MTAWDNIDAELHRRRLGWQWLADRLEMTIQRVANWKVRGVPAKHLRQIAEILQPISIDEIEGVQSKPPTTVSGWPFPLVDESRYRNLRPEIQGYLQSELNALIKSVESLKPNKYAER